MNSSTATIPPIEYRPSHSDALPLEDPLSGWSLQSEGGDFAIRITYVDGQYLVEDIDSYTFGTGSTEDEAVEDWMESIEARYRVLLGEEGGLAPYLADQLKDLKQKFSAVPYASSTA